MAFSSQDVTVTWVPIISNGTTTTSGNFFTTDHWALPNHGGFLAPGTASGLAGNPSLVVGAYIGNYDVTVASTNSSGIFIPTTILEDVVGLGITLGPHATLNLYDTQLQYGVSIINASIPGTSAVGNLSIHGASTNDGVILASGIGNSELVSIGSGGSLVNGVYTKTIVNSGTTTSSQVYGTLGANFGGYLSIGGAGTIFNYSTISAYNGTVVVGSSVYGSKTLTNGYSGTISLGDAGTFIVGASVNGQQLITFTSGYGNSMLVDTAPGITLGSTVGFDIPAVHGFNYGAGGTTPTSLASLSSNALIFNSAAIPGSIVGYSTSITGNTETLYLDETLAGTLTTLALPFSDNTALLSPQIFQSAGKTYIVANSAENFVGTSQHSWFDSANWNLGFLPDQVVGTGVNGQPFTFPHIAELNSSAVAIKPTLAAQAALNDTTIALANGSSVSVYGVTLGANSKLVSTSGENILNVANSMTNFGTILVAGTSSSDGLAVSLTSSASLINNGLFEVIGANDPATISGGTFVNNGTIEANGTATSNANTLAGEIIIDTTVTGTGIVQLDNAGIIIVNGPLGAGQTIDFADGSSSILDLNSTTAFTNGSFAPVVESFSSKNAIDLTGALYNASFTDSVTSAGGFTTLALTLGGTAIYDLAFAGSPSNLTVNAGTFLAAGASSAVSALVITAPCFAAGTRILTALGEVAVEDLAAGDEVITIATGQPRMRQITWIGQRRVDLRRHVSPDKVAPIVIEPGALGDQLPQRALIVSPDHALLLDGVLIEAKYLVNGVTVKQDFSRTDITYFHIELASHDALLAEGVAAESYLDSGNRGSFTNGWTSIALFPDFAAPSRPHSFAPLVTSGPILTSLRARLHAIACDAGFTARPAPELRLEIDGKPAIPLGKTDDVWRFLIQAGAQTAILTTKGAVPAESDPASNDRRCLGVALRRILIQTAHGAEPIPLDHPALTTGFFPPEPDVRWSGPEARIDLSQLPPGILVLQIQAFAPTWHRAA